MVSMATERIQGEATATSTLPLAVGEVKIPFLQLAIGLQESFGDRLDKAVSAATSDASSSTGKPISLLNAEPALKTDDPSVKKSSVWSTPILPFNIPTPPQPENLEPPQSSVPLQAPDNKAQPMETKLPTTAAPDESGTIEKI